MTRVQSFRLLGRDGPVTVDRCCDTADIEADSGDRFRICSSPPSFDRGGREKVFTSAAMIWTTTGPSKGSGYFTNSDITLKWERNTKNNNKKKKKILEQFAKIGHAVNAQMSG